MPHPLHHHGLVDKDLKYLKLRFLLRVSLDRNNPLPDLVHLPAQDQNHRVDNLLFTALEDLLDSMLRALNPRPVSRQGKRKHLEQILLEGLREMGGCLTFTWGRLAAR